MTSRLSTRASAAKSSAPPSRKKRGPALAVSVLLLIVAAASVYFQASERASTLCWNGRRADTVPARRASNRLWITSPRQTSSLALKWFNPCTNYGSARS